MGEGGGVESLTSQHMDMGLILLCARAVGGRVPGNSQEIKCLPSSGPQVYSRHFIHALETLENFEGKAQNVSESEGKSIRFPTEKQMALS